MKDYPAHKGLEAPVCEHRDCDSVIVITETLFGHKLTLCEDHGRDVDYLLVEGYDAFYDWTQDFLKVGVRGRWRRRKRESSPEEKVRKRKKRKEDGV
jgi:hypothetical protein